MHTRWHQKQQALILLRIKQMQLFFFQRVFHSSASFEDLSTV